MKIDIVAMVRDLLMNYDLGSLCEVRPMPHPFKFLARARVADGRWFVVKGEHEPSAQTLRKYAVENYAAQAGFPTPRTHRNHSGKLVTRLGDVDYVVTDFLAGVEGPWRQPLHQRDQAARLLARLHAVLKEMPDMEGEECQSDLPAAFKQETTDFCRLVAGVGEMGAPGNEVDDFILRQAETISRHAAQVLDQLSQSQYEALPKTHTHGDYAPVNHLISGQNNLTGDVMAIIDFKPVKDLRARDCVEVFKEPQVAFARRHPVVRLLLRSLEGLGLRSVESTKSMLVRFVAVYQNEAEKTGYPLTEAEVKVMPTIFRMARLRMLFWLEHEKDRLTLELSRGDRAFFRLFEVLLKELNEDFGTASALAAWDAFPDLVKQEQRRLRTPTQAHGK